MSLAVADKLLRAFEALKNFKDGMKPSDPTVVQFKKKESTLSKKDRITNLNVISDLTCSPLIRNLSEYGTLVAVSIETLLSFCDDEEPDVRLVAGDCINRITKGFMDTNIARIPVELYKEIKKNGPPRCLRAALSKFADICHIIRPHKCRPFITNLLPCIARICPREDDSVQETLATAIQKILPVLGAFMNDKEIKVLLKTFLQNFNSPSAMTRRTAASSLTMICLHARKPAFFFSWIINILLEPIASLEQNPPTSCGALLCLRHIIPHLGSEEADMVVMRGSFGVTHQQKEQPNEEIYEREEKQLLQMYKVIMQCTKHADHNVVTAALETLQQLLQSLPKKLLCRLSSDEGLTPISTQDCSGGLFATEFQDIDNLSFTLSRDSGIEEPLAEISVEGGTEKVQDSALSVDDIREMRRHFSQPEEGNSEVVNDAASEMSENGSEGFGSIDTDNDSLSGHNRSGSDTSAIVTRTNSTDELNIDEREPQGFTEDSLEALDNEGQTTGVDNGFTIDPVECRGIPILHCARVMCSFLLSGRTNEVLSDRKVRVSVKSLALGCLATIFKLYPKAFFAHVVPEGDGEETESDFQQLVCDVLLYEGHHDPQVRGSLAILLGNFLESSLKLVRSDFASWCAESCKNVSAQLSIADMLNVLEKLMLDESSVTARLACFGLRQCLPALWHSTYSYLAIELCIKIVQLKRNPYWLVKVVLLQIVSDFDFSLIGFLEKLEKQTSSDHATNNSFNLQQTFFHDVVLELLVDDDLRVRSEAARTIVKLVPNLFFESDFLRQEPLLSVAKKTLEKTLDLSASHLDTEMAIIKNNLARVITTLSHHLNTAISKHAVLGYCEALSLLSNTYPVGSWPSSWGCDVIAIIQSPPPTGKTGFPAFTGSTTVSSPPPPLAKPLISSILCNNGGGSLSFVVELMTSSWLTLNLRAHDDAILLVGNLLVGVASSAISHSVRESDENSSGSNSEPAGKWTVFCDSSISALADKVFVHILRILNICFHIIDNVTPGAHSAKVSLLGKDKDKSSAPIPGAAVPSTSSPQISAAVSSPKKLLYRSRKNTDVDSTNTSGEKGSLTKGHSEADGKSGGTSAGAMVGQFHQLPHYYKLYEVIKGAFSNYKVNLKFQDDDKFVKFVKTTLTVFSMLLELASFTDIGKHVEEIIGYLQATVKCEAGTSFLCVQQMLRSIFGVNVASQPEHNSSNFPSEKQGLVTEVILPPFLQGSSKAVHNVGFYQSYFEEFQTEVSEALEEIRKREQTKESKSFKDFAFVKKLRERRGSFRPPLKVDKQVHIHSYIRMFEPLVIQALKEYTSSSSIQIQAQVLSILVQLIRLRVNYALLDSEQAFLNFVLKQFEFIKAGQLRGTELFSPHVFQFLILLSYECFQPRFNQAKSVFGMSRIIQVCDDLMACGQSARTHAIPALRPIVYDLFDLQTTGRNENSKELDTQREVFISMLLRLSQFPEILKLIVYVLNFYRQNDDKWKKFSRQAVDITLQMLVKQQVIIDDQRDLKCLEGLFDAVAPIALRPIDVILKAVFAPANLSSSSLVKRWLSQVLVLLKVIITQNTEENILSRITQLEFKGSLIGNIVDSEELEDADLAAECSPDKILVYFFIHTLYVAARDASRTDGGQGYGKEEDDGFHFVFRMTSYLLLYLQDIVKSGLFKSVTTTALTVIKEGLLGEDSTRSSDVKVKKINELLLSLKETQPVMFLQWLQLLFTLGFDDDGWWTSLLGKVKEKTGELTTLSVNGHISLKGTFLIYCKILGSRIKNVEDSSKFEIFLHENLTDLVQMSHEPPVKTLLRQIYSSSLCSQVFIAVVRNQSCKGSIKNIHKLNLKKDLLLILDDLHYKQTNSLIQLLTKEFLSSNYRAITRKCETMICSRLEYCISLPKEELGTFFSPEDIRNIHDSLISLGVTKRNPRLASLISHMSPDSINAPVAKSILDFESAVEQLKKKEPNHMSWYYSFVYNCCCSLNSNEVGIKHLEEVVHLLHVLNFEQITKIMDDEKFNTALLRLCLAFSIEKTTRHYYGKFDHESLGNPFEDSTYFNTYGVDHLFQCSYGLLLRHIQEIVFSVTTFDDEDPEADDEDPEAAVGRPETRKPEFELALITSSMNHSEIERLSQNLQWKQKLLEITQALEVYLALMDQLPTEARLPKAIHCAVCQFGMIALEVLCEESRRCSLCCTSKLTIVLRCFSRVLHNRHLYLVVNSFEYSKWVSHSLRSIYHLVRTVFVHPGNNLPDNVPDDPRSSQNDRNTTLKQASALVNYLYTVLNQKNSSHHSSVPSTLTQTFRDVIAGLARLSLFNSYARVPPLAWKMGWDDVEHDKELPPLPIDILREKDVLQDFVLRVNSIGWISRQQFEETWAALLGVLSSPLLPDQSSREEDIESIKSGCLALQCITALLLQTTLYPLPGNPAVGTNLHTSRHKELPFLDSRAGKKLRCVRKIVEDHFLLQCRQSSPLQTTINADHLYRGNIERVDGLHSYSLGQISINSLQAQCAVPPNDYASELSETDPVSSNISSRPSSHEKIDVRSCVQFLMELFEQWVSPYTQPKTPLMLLTESVKSLLIISDLFVDPTQYECMLSELLDLYQNYPAEDEIMMQYLLPALCKALAVLKLEGVVPEKIVKIMETSFKAPHVPLQVSCLYGALYLLESRTSSVVGLVIPLVTDYVQKVLAVITDTSVFGEHRLLVLLSTSFYMLENYESEITDVEFKNNFLKAVITMASAKDESTPLSIYHAILRGLERLVVSFSLSLEDSDALVKLSVDRLAMRNPQRAISALGLLLTCMYTGKEGDRPSGLFAETDVIDTPTDDTLLVALERVTALFDRIRKGFRSEAKLVSDILPIVLGDFFPAQDVMNKVIGEFVSSQQPHPELMASVLCKVCRNLISQGQQKSVKDWVLLSLGSFAQRPPLGMAIWSFTCVFIASSSNRWIRALFSHVVSRIGKLESIDRQYFLITATDFYLNQNLTEEEKQSFKSTFEKVAQSGTPYADLISNMQTL